MNSSFVRGTIRLCIAAATVLALIFFGAVSRSQTTNASTVQRAGVSRVAVSGLEAACRPEVVQALAAKLQFGVTVKTIPNGPQLPGGTRFVAAVGRVPAYCRVTGSFVTDPKTGKTANFLATLPDTWNRNYLQFGCGGHCGAFIVNDAASPVIPITSQGSPGESIVKGYASFGTDEGHTSPFGGSWAAKGPGQVDQDAIDDFYYRADEVLARMGKAFAAAFYSHATGTSQKVAYSYFMGCSDGGRDALVAAAFFPEEFDGIVAGSPYANMVGVALQSAAGALAPIRSPDSDVPPALMSKVDAIVKAKCDAIDGVKDGLIQNPAACDFIPERDLPRCDGKTNGADCFTRAQTETISALISAVTDEHGNVVQPGYTISDLQDALRIPAPPTDPSAAEPWSASSIPPIAMWGLSDAVLKVFVHQNDPNFHIRSLISFGSGGPGPITTFHAIVPQAEVGRATAATRMGIGVHPERMQILIHENRKLLIWANLSDQLLTPYMSINYYKRLAAMYGGYSKLQNTIRLFLIPDTAHCSMSGCGPSNFDALSAIESWVEDHTAPDSLLATQYVQRPSVSPLAPPVADTSKPPMRTMPLCKFPEMAHYTGEGDVKDAANWSCPAGDRSMLKVGESGRLAGVLE